MANEHVMMPAHTRSHVWYRDTTVEASELHHGDVARGRENSCGACTVLENRPFPGADRYVIYACCGGQRYRGNAPVLVAAPRLSAGTLESSPARHPHCRCRWN